ncbi:hypothetical protein F1559_001539 [Cyanidiococcus yangmingshanensis]|uniref:Methyltransferase domain-containing protein n=1 Tax=Cyanidiococcus yangmingshanensis TaxID=2690220 RepID=A0A7J7IL08_9RHOD|nr:hypothetical protein F1559_001539 [Cyanidiococcus yangmingshanensis]
MTAFELGVFTAVAEGNHTAEDVARATATSTRGMRLLMDALVSLDLLQKHEGAYHLLPGSEALLVKTSPQYLGYRWETNHLWSAWSALTEVVRTGQPYTQLEKEPDAARFFPKLIRSLHVMNLEAARKMAQILMPSQIPMNSRVLDIACGTGVWSIPFAEASTQVQLDLLDFADALAVAKDYVQAIATILIILGNIVHSEGAKSSQDLIRRCARALCPGGKLVIIDLFPNEERTGPPRAVLFALNMLLNTSEGDTFSVSEYNAWFQDAGLTEGSLVELDDNSTALIAAKP